MSLFKLKKHKLSKVNQAKLKKIKTANRKQNKITKQKKLVGHIFNLKDSISNQHLPRDKQIPYRRNMAVNSHDVVVTKQNKNNTVNVRTITTLAKNNSYRNNRTGQIVERYQYRNSALERARKGIIDVIPQSAMKTNNWAGIHRQNIKNVSIQNLEPRKYAKRAQIPKRYRNLLK